MQAACVTCGAELTGDRCTRCGRPRVLPIGYLSLIDDLARGIVEAAVREDSFEVFSDEEAGRTPLQNAISRAARHVLFWHYDGDGCTEHPTDPADLQTLLIAALDRISAEVLKKDWGYETPSPRKLIREGHTIARAAILAVPAIEPDYLDRVIAALDTARQRQDASGISGDGWEDKDGYILSGIGDARREAEKLRR